MSANSAAPDWKTLSTLLDTVLSLPPQARLEWVEQLGSDHDALKPLLRDLLTRKELGETGDFLATLPKLADGAAERRVEGASGQLIGVYRLIRLLGTGGMGSVWLAERADGQLTRKVALKLPHLTQGFDGLAQRMARERDILAALEHPNIARLYDAGVASDGRPYLALEYVEGESIESYCDSRALNANRRLRLMVQVARAVAFAHARLIVHRDLKPSNILIDADGQAHLLDFGIAKIIAAGTAAETQLTQMGGRAFTLDYASPEQIRGDAIGTATDIYSLGVVLYELLTGSRPFAAAEGSGLLPLAVKTLSAEPRRPSDVVALAALRRRLRGDLDTIVLKALKKEPAERYATADELAADLERHLNGEPVSARPDTTWYRARKFTARNKVLVGATAAAMMALAVGLTVSLWQARIARSEARTARAVEQFLMDIFQKNSKDQPDPAQARQTTVRELLAMGTQLVNRSMNDAPASKLRVVETLAGMQQDLELWDEAVALNRERVSLARSVYGADDPRVAAALIDLSLSMIGSRSANERKQTLDEARAILDRRSDTTSPLRGRLSAELASYFSNLDVPKALVYSQQSVRLLGAGASKELVDALEIEGWLFDELRREPESERAYRQAISIAQSVYGPNNAHLPMLYAYLAGSQFHLREFAAAEQNLRQGWDIARSLSGPDSGDAMQLEMRLGQLLARTGRLNEGLAHLAAATAAVEKARGADDPLYTPMIEESYGVALTRAGNLPDAVRYLSRATDTWRHGLAGSTYLMAVMEEQALARILRGELNDAQKLLDEAGVIRAKSGTHATNLNGDVEARVELLLSTAHTEEAQEALSQLYLPAAESAADSFAVMNAALLRARVALARGDAEAASIGAAGVYRLVVTHQQRAYLRSFEAQAALVYGSALRRLQSPAQAEPLLRDALNLQTELQDPVRSPLLAEAMLELSDCLLDLRNPQEARALLERARVIDGANDRLDEHFRARLLQVERRVDAARLARSRT